MGHDRVRRAPEAFRVLALSALLVYGVGAATTDHEGHTVVMGPVLRRRRAFSMRLAARRVGRSLDGTSETRGHGVRRTDPGTQGAKRRLLRATAACRVGMERATRAYGLHALEYPWRMGLATLGLRRVVSANDLVARYLGLEWQSLCRYVLAAFRRGSAYSTEAGLKYFILGAVCSGLYLRGAGRVYGARGTVSFGEIGLVLRVPGTPDPRVAQGLVRILVRRLFKRAAVPFHTWILDVYEGSPSPTTLYFASVPKAAILYVRLTRCYGPFASRAFVWQPLLVGCAVATRLVSPRRALSQRRVKRFLAASAMGHVGYRLLAVSALSLEGVQAARIYRAVYRVTSVNVWLAVRSVQHTGLDSTRNAKYLTELGGRAGWNPFLAATVSVSMRSMAGVPPRGGFFAKRSVFLATMSQGLVTLSIFAVLASCVGAFYYLRVLKLIYFEPAPDRGGVRGVPLDRGASRVRGGSLGFLRARVFVPGPRRLRTHRMALAVCG